MDQKNSGSLIKLTDNDTWQVSCVNVSADNVEVQMCNNKLYLACNRGRDGEFIDIALDKPSAQALVAKMQELIEGME